MTEENENLILRLLRDMRSEMAAMRKTQEAQGDDLTAIRRQMVEFQETTAMALGFSVSANAHYETTAQRLDKLTSTVQALEARVAELERQP